jgi:hypothetical protein
VCFSTRLLAQQMFPLARRVKWTSPRHFTHRFDSLHLGGDANLYKAAEIPLEKKAREDAAKFG